MAEPRIAVFRQRVLDNAYSDAPLTVAVLAVLDSGQCPHCGAQVTPIRGDLLEDGRIVICESCGYWAGRGTRLGGPTDHRVVRGLIEHVDLDAVDLPELITHLHQIPERLLDLSPYRAERVVMDLLGQALQCEVEPVGGRRDGGVDGYIVRGEGLRTLVQVKWHRDKNRAESVRLVREVAGTLLARGVPSGLIVTTRTHFSSDATRELDEVHKREVVNIGRIELAVKVYQDLLDMLDLAWIRQGESFEAATPWLRDTSIDETMSDGTPGSSWIFSRSPWP